MSDYQGLFQGLQLELSYALVGATSLRALSQVDELLTIHCGERSREVTRDHAVFRCLGPRHIISVQTREIVDGPSAAQAKLEQEYKLLR